RLLAQADEVGLDPALVLVPEGEVAKAVRVERAAELAVDPVEEVQVEPGGDAGRVVIGGFEREAVLDEVDPDEEPAAGPRRLSGVEQERGGLASAEVADRRAGEVDDAPAGDRERRKLEVARVVGGDGRDEELGIGAAERLGGE